MAGNGQNRKYAGCAVLSLVTRPCPPNGRVPCPGRGDHIRLAAVGKPDPRRGLQEQQVGGREPRPAVGDKAGGTIRVKPERPLFVEVAVETGAPCSSMWGNRQGCIPFWVLPSAYPGLYPFKYAPPHPLTRG